MWSWVSSEMTATWWLNWTRWQHHCCWMTTHNHVKRWSWEERVEHRSGCGTGSMMMTRGVHTLWYDSIIVNDWFRDDLPACRCLPVPVLSGSDVEHLLITNYYYCQVKLQSVLSIGYTIVWSGKHEFVIIIGQGNQGKVVEFFFVVRVLSCSLCISNE